MTDGKGLPTLRERAERTLAEIEKRFALGGGFYRDKDGADGAAFNWGLGVLLSAYVAAARLDPSRYAGRVRALTDALERGYWRSDGPVGGYNASRTDGRGTPDRYYDDNAWLALAWAEAASARELGPAYRAPARRALAFVLSGYDGALGGGVWWHEQKKASKHACSTAPAAAAVLAVSGDTATARRLHAWLTNALRDPADGLYWDALTVEGRVERAKWSYNSALPLRVETISARTWGAPVYRARAARLAEASVARWYKPSAAILVDDASFAHLLCEDLLRASAVTGDAKTERAARTSLDTLWARVRRPDGTYPKRWDPDARETAPTELLWIASAARAYAFGALWAAGREGRGDAAA